MDVEARDPIFTPPTQPTAPSAAPVDAEAAAPPGARVTLELADAPAAADPPATRRAPLWLFGGAPLAPKRAAAAGAGSTEADRSSTSATDEPCSPSCVRLADALEGDTPAHCSPDDSRFLPRPAAGAPGVLASAGLDEAEPSAADELGSPRGVRLADVHGPLQSLGRSEPPARPSPAVSRRSSRPRAASGAGKAGAASSTCTRSRGMAACCVLVTVALALLLCAVVYLTANGSGGNAAARRELPAGPIGGPAGDKQGASPRGMPNATLAPPGPPPPLPSSSAAVSATILLAADSVSTFNRTAFKTDLAHALEISAERVRIDGVRAGSVVVDVRIVGPPRSAAAERSSASVRSLLQALSPTQMQARFPAGSQFVVQGMLVDAARPPLLPPSSPPPPTGSGWPSLPSLPALPNVTLPSLPALPNVTDLPGLPGLPDLPAFPNVSLPNVSLPNVTLPDFPTPQLPGNDGANPSLSVPGWWPWDGLVPPIPPLPFAPSVPTGVPVPLNLTASAAVEALWTNWLGLWWHRNRTRFPDEEQLLREPYEACALPPVATTDERVVQLLVAMHDAPPSHAFVAGTSSSWADATRVALGATDPSALSRGELDRTAALLRERRAEALDALPLVSVLLLTAPSSSALGAALLFELKAGALSFSYWLDEFGGPGKVDACGGMGAEERTRLLDRGDLGTLTYWADDEAIVLHAAQHLLGHALPDSMFAPACRTGAQQRARGEELVLRWLHRRLSPSMGLSVMDDDVALGRVVSALAALADLSPSAEVRSRCQLGLDALLLQLSVSAFKGSLPMSRGQRTAGLSGLSLSSNLAWLLGGEGTCLLGEPASAALALSSLRDGYHAPHVLSAIQAALEPAYGFDDVMRTRDGADVSVGTAQWLGLGYGGGASVAECEYWLSLGGAAAPIAAECPFILGRAYGFARGPLSAYRFLLPLAGIALNVSLPLDLGAWAGVGGDGGAGADGEAEPMTLLGGALRLVSPAARGAVKASAHLYQYRMGGAALVSLLDYSPGALGVSGRHPMTASLSPAEGALIFTSQPLRPAFRASAHDWWSVQASMPRVAQWREISISIYNPPLEVSALLPLLNGDIPPQLTHAHFNKSAFDEYRVVVGRDGRATWHCARKGSGFVALLSHQPASFAESGPYAGVDLQADGYRNVWIAHVGDESVDGSFHKWADTVRKGWVNVNILPPGPDRDGGLPWCLWQHRCVAGLPEQLDYWKLIKCVQWIPFVNTRPPCGHTLESMGFVRCYLGCDLPDWRLCLALCAVKSIDWSLPSGTFGRVQVEYVPYGKPALEFGWEGELRVGRRWNAVRREPYPQLNDRLATPFAHLAAGPGPKLLDARAGGDSMNLDFGQPPRRTVVNQP